MSLEKEPAGAFNKAQRLIEPAQYIPLSGICKEGKPFVSATLLSGLIKGVPVGVQGRLYRLTALRDSGHVDTNKLLRRDE